MSTQNNPKSPCSNEKDSLGKTAGNEDSQQDIPSPKNENYVYPLDYPV